jgi:hypothetical protein
MHRRSFGLAAVSASLLAFLLPGPAGAEGVRISGPVVHENLAIYFIHGPSASGPVPLTLQEAMAKGSVKVQETGQVNELAIQNLGSEEVFVQSGDIVKGGRQDRVLMVSLLLPPRSGVIPIASFCVEHGRWTARGGEDSKTFSSSNSAVPSQAARLAMRAPPAPEPTSQPPQVDPTTHQINPLSSIRPGRVYDGVGDRQGKIWDSVASTQAKLSQNLAVPVAAPASATSLQLSLENEKLKAAQAAFVGALQSEGEKDGDIVGYAFAVNGKLTSADVYPSNALFRKMWAKLLSANVTEAIAEKDAKTGAPPAVDAVRAFLDAAQKGAATERDLTAGAALEARDSDGAIYSETRRVAGGWVHRNYLAK